MPRNFIFLVFFLMIYAKLPVWGSGQLDSLSLYYDQEDYNNALRFLNEIDTTSLSDADYVDYCIIGTEVYHFKGNYKKAISFYNKGKQIKWLDKEDEVKIMMAGLMTFTEIADRKKSEPLFQELEQKISKYGVDSSILLDYNLLAVNYFNLIGENDRAMKRAIKALKLIDASGTPANKTSIYITIGEIMRTNNKPNKALIYYARAEKIAKQEELFYALGKIYNNQSIIARDQGDTLTSIEKLEHSARMYHMSRGDAAAAPAYYNLGLQYIDIGKYAEGRRYIRKVLDIGIANGFDKAKYFGFYGMGYYYEKLGNVKDAEHHFMNALEIAKKHNNPPNIGRVYEALYLMYKKNNISDKALKYFELNKEIVDSLDIVENEAVIENLEARYQLAQKEKENKELRLIQTRQRLSFFIGGGVILILIMVLVFLYLTLRNKHRQNRLLALQKEQIDNKNSQLNELNEAVFEQKKQLEDLNQLKDTMFSIISHDLRSPLSSVYMLMRMIDEQGLDTAKGLEMVKELSREVNQSLFLLNNLMIWSNINLQQVQPYFESFSVKSIVSEVVDFFKNDIEFKKLNVRVDIDKGLNVWADLNMTQTILQNLLSNAIRFSYEAGEIVVAATKQENKILITVEDYGEGIDQGKIKEIFEPAVRLKKGTMGERGVGLGLNISNTYAELMEGELKIVSLDSGTRVDLWLLAGE